MHRSCESAVMSGDSVTTDVIGSGARAFPSEVRLRSGHLLTRCTNPGSDPMSSRVGDSVSGLSSGWLTGRGRVIGDRRTNDLIVIWSQSWSKT